MHQHWLKLGYILAVAQLGNRHLAGDTRQVALILGVDHSLLAPPDMGHDQVAVVGVLGLKEKAVVAR